MAGSIHLGDLEAPALDTATQRLGTASSAEHESTFEHQAFGGDPATGGSRSMPGSFPEDTPPPSPTASTNSVPESLAHPFGEETHAPETASDAGEGPHTPSISSTGHGIHPESSGGSAHTLEAAASDDRFDQASQAEAGHAGPATEGEAAQPSGRVTRWAAQNHKFGDMFDKALKPYTVPLTVGGLTAGLGIGIYNAVKK